MKNWISYNVLEQMSVPSGIRKMFNKSKIIEKEFGKENVFDFSLGNPSIEPPLEFTKTGIDVLKNNILGKHAYIDHQGLLETRSKVVKHINDKYDTNCQSNDIIMTAGAAGALNVILKSILNQDDEIIVFTPYFSEYDSYIKNYGGKPIYVELDKDFEINLLSLSEKITANTRAIIINTPHNPTGKAFSIDNLKEINKVIEQYEKKYNIALYTIFDSPYDQLYYGDFQCNPFSIFKRLLFIGSFSKDFGIAGERLGYIALAENLEAKQIVLDAILHSTRTLGFVNAPVLVQRIIASMKDLKVDPTPYKIRRDIMIQILKNAGYNVIVPDGGIFAFAESPIKNDKIFCEFLADNYRVFTVPGSYFKGQGYFRISFSNSIEKISNSEQAFKQAFKQAKIIL